MSSLTLKRKSIRITDFFEFTMPQQEHMSKIHAFSCRSIIAVYIKIEKITASSKLKSGITCSHRTLRIQT
jgi:hypothetical protein